MDDARLGSIYKLLHQTLGREGESPLTDAQLLERFVESRDEAAYEVLVHRHSRAVWNACRRVLSRDHDAEDAFQATFLILTRKAGSIARRESLAAWLRKVARRVALKAKTKATKQTSREQRRAVPDAAEDPTPAFVQEEIRSILDEEIQRLPSKYRLPFVLCHLEGKTNAEAGKELGCPQNTIATRLARARQKLAKQLTRRGVALPAGLTAAIVLDKAAAAVPVQLVSTAVRAGLAYAASGVRSGIVSPSAVTLAEETIRSMLVTKVGIVAGVVMFAGLLAGGAGFVVSRKSIPTEDANMKKASNSAVTAAKEKRPEEQQAVKEKKTEEQQAAKEKRPEEQQATLPTTAQPPTVQFEAGLHDGRTLKLKLKDEQVQMITSEGKKFFHMNTIRRIEFANSRHLSDELRAQIDTAVADLGNNEFQQREKAVAVLRQYGGKAYTAILQASKSQDPEVSSRANKLLTDLRDHALDEEILSDFGQHDILYTIDANFVGRIDPASLTLSTNQTNAVQLKANDLDFLQSLSVDLAVKFVEKLGGRVVRDEKADGRPVTEIDFREKKLLTNRNLKEFGQLSTPLSTLRTFYLIDCKQITDDGLKELREFKGVQELCLGISQRITDAGLKELKEFKDLQSLNLSNCEKITDDGLKEIKELKGLKKLNLGACKEITNSGLKELTALKGLESLNIESCKQITDDGLKELKEFKSLQALSLSGCPITDAGLKELKELKDLKELDLVACKQITGDGLKELKDLKRLRYLNLFSCEQLTDASMKELKQFKALQDLSLGDCKQITDAGLKEFKEFKVLQLLSLVNCEKITDAAVDELKKNLPQLRIRDPRWNYK